MLSNMRTTFIIDDGLMAQLRDLARRRSTTMTELVDRALRMLIEAESGRVPDAEEIPIFDMGESLVDVGDRRALYDLLDET